MSYESEVRALMAFAIQEELNNAIAKVRKAQDVLTTRFMGEQKNGDNNDKVRDRVQASASMILASVLGSGQVMIKKLVPMDTQRLIVAASVDLAFLLEEELDRRAHPRAEVIASAAAER